MTDEETIKQSYELLCMFARNIAMLPLEQWLNDLNRAESVGVIVDPTLMRSYLRSGKGDIIKSIIEAAIPLKRAVLDAQTSPAMLRELGESIPAQPEKP